MENNTILSINHVSKLFKKFKALDDISLQIKQQDFYALLGPNGAGKTTLIGIITDLIMPTSGAVIVDGYDLRKQTEQAKMIMGVVPQEINLNTFEKVDQTLYQQAQYYGLKPRLVKQRVAYLLEKLQLTAKAKNHNMQLSGGMKRRLMIARALIHSPKILLLDEPTAGVDVEVRKSLWDFLREENKNGLTILLTTHHLEEAEQLCNTVGLIKHGKCTFEGEMSALLNELETERIFVEIEDIKKFQPCAALQAMCDEIKGKKLCIRLARGQKLQRVIELINQSGGNIIRIEHQEGRLEQVFINKLVNNN